MERQWFTVLITSIIFLLLALATGLNRLLELGIFLLVLGSIGIVLFRIYVGLRTKLNESDLKRREQDLAMLKLEHAHDENVLGLGYLPTDEGYIPIRLQLSGGVTPFDDVSIDANGETITSTKDYARDAYELILLTSQAKKYGPDQTQIMPFNKARVASEHFKNVRTWRGAASWLMVHGHARQDRDKEKILGTYTQRGTIGDLLQKLGDDHPSFVINPRGSQNVETRNARNAQKTA